jgi:hypothetical protein
LLVRIAEPRRTIEFLGEPRQRITNYPRSQLGSRVDPTALTRTLGLTALNEGIVKLRDSPCPALCETALPDLPVSLPEERVEYLAARRNHMSVQSRQRCLARLRPPQRHWRAALGPSASFLGVAPSRAVLTPGLLMRDLTEVIDEIIDI